MSKSQVVPLFLGVVAVLGGSVIDSAYGASISSIQPISYGIIIVDSNDNTIVEIDARNAVALPRVVGGGLAHVSGGASGLIQVYSDVAGQSIILSYPDSILLKSGVFSMTLDGITSRSKQFAVSSSVGTIDFNVGGLLHVNAGQSSKNYSGSITVNVTINNP